MHYWFLLAIADVDEPLPGGLSGNQTFIAFIFRTAINALVVIVPLFIAYKQLESRSDQRANEIAKKADESAAVAAQAATEQIAAVEQHLTGQLQNGIKSRLDAIHETVQATAPPTTLDADTNAKVTDVQHKVNDLQKGG